MSEQSKCPQCGHDELGQGVLSGYSQIRPVGRPLSIGSDLLAVICTSCGHILSWKVAKPAKFISGKSKEKK